MVPLKVFFQNGKAKIELGVARGKRQWDKRQAMAERDAKRETDRAIRAATIAAASEHRYHGRLSREPTRGCLVSILRIEAGEASRGTPGSSLKIREKK